MHLFSIVYKNGKNEHDDKGFCKKKKDYDVVNAGWYKVQSFIEYVWFLCVKM